MARYKHIDTSPRFLAVDLERQFLPGTFEHALNHLLDHEIDLSGFDARYGIDATGAAAYGTSRKGKKRPPAQKSVAAGRREHFGKAKQRGNHPRCHFFVLPRVKKGARRAWHGGSPNENVRGDGQKLHGRPGLRARWHLMAKTIGCGGQGKCCAGARKHRVLARGDRSGVAMSS